MTAAADLAAADSTASNDSVLRISAAHVELLEEGGPLLKASNISSVRGSRLVKRHYSN